MTTVKFEVRNDSVVLLSEDENISERPCIILLLIMFFSITFNSIIIVTILRSSYRSYIYNILLLSLCLSLILETGLNLIQASIIRASWSDLYEQLGSDSLKTFCHLNAASMQWPCLLQFYFLALLSAHRSLVLGVPGKQPLDDNLKIPGFRTIRRLNGLSWLLAPLLVLPLAFRAIDCGHFHERYSCSPILATKTLSAVFASVLYLLGYLLPWTVLFRFWIVILTRVTKERRRLQSLELVAVQRAAAQSSPIRGLGPSLGFSVPTWSQVWGTNDPIAGEGFRYFLLTGLLTLFHLFLVVPHSIYAVITTFYEEYEIVPKRMTIFQDNNSDLPPELRPIVTSCFDNIFIWLRFLYPTVVPITIVLIHRDLRRHCRNLFNSCRSQNHVHASGSSLSGYLLTKKYQKRRKKSKLTTLDDVKTPVLFATGEGIYLRTAAVPYSGLSSFKTSWNKSGVIEPRFISVFADLGTKSCNKSIPKLSKTPEMPTKRLNNDVENLEDDDGRKRPRKGGKTVRFSQKISEIPLNDSGISSNFSEENVVVTIKPASELRLAERKLSEPSERLPNDPFGSFTKPLNIKESKIKRPTRSLEHLLAESSSLTSSSSSLLLSLSQRMRNRTS